MNNVCKVIISIFTLCLPVMAAAADYKIIPDSKAAANQNAEAIAQMINAGRSVVVNGTYYVGKAKTKLRKNIVIKGTGTLITITSDNFYVNAPVSITLSGITLKTTENTSATSKIRFIVNEGVNYHKKLIVKNCTISGVRVYTQVAEDVDQVTVRDGVKKVVFSNNRISYVGTYVLLMNNCRSEKVKIESNTMTRMYALGFGFGVDNAYKDLGFARMKKVYFRNNTIDNAGLVITDADEVGSTYMTPIICEADYCLCEGNTIKNILATKHQPIALYPFYLSCNEAVIRKNVVQDCLHLANSDYNEMFKCKNGPNGIRSRIIEGNRFVVTQGSLKIHSSKDEMPFLRFVNFQSNDVGDIVIKDNVVDLACDFVFGAGKRCRYSSFLFENNIISYRAVGKTARQLLRLNAASGNGGKIVVRNNVMNPSVQGDDVYGLFSGDCSGYAFEITNNRLSGCLPTGDSDVDPKRPLSFKSVGNRVDLGKSHSIVRISRDVSCDDTFVGGDNYTMYVYPGDIMTGTLRFHFEGTAPVNVLTFTKLPKAGECEVVATDEYGTRHYTCGTDDKDVYMKSHDGGGVKRLAKGIKASKAYVGETSHNIGRMISDGESIYYSTPSSYRGNMTLEIKYRTSPSIQ